MPQTKRKAEEDLCEILWDEIICNSVSHLYAPIPEYASQMYRCKTVKVKTEKGETELEVGDRMIYNGRQMSYPESFDYSSLKPGDKVYHIPRVRGGVLTMQTQGRHMRSANVSQTEPTVLGEANHCQGNYSMKKVKVKSELGETQLYLGDRVAYDGQQLKKLPCNILHWT